jgi:hypothetical protein
VLAYYKVDSRRVSYREYWRMASGFGFLVAAWAKFFGDELPFNTGAPRLDAIVPLDEALAMQTPLGPLVADAEAAGLQKQFYYTIPMLGPVTGLACALLSRDNTILANAIYSRAKSGEETTAATVFSALSRLPDTRCMSTSNARRQLNAPPNIVANYLPETDVRGVLGAHGLALARKHWNPLSIRTDEVEAVLVELNNAAIDYHVSRGVYVEMTAEEVAGLQAMFE